MRIVLISATALGLSFGATQAASYTVTTTVMGAYEPPIEIFVLPFDQSLGTLTSDTLDYKGYFEDTIMFASFYPEPSPVTFTNSVGFYNGTHTVSVPSQTVPLTSADSVSEGFRFEVVDSLPIDYFLTPDLMTGPRYGLTELSFDVDDNASLVGLDYADDNITIGGTITETFTYDPIPEPASVLLLGAGVLSLCAAIRQRRV